MWDVVIAPIFAVLATLICGKLYYKHHITLVEMIISIIVGTVVSVGIYYLLVFASLASTEVWNGVVTSKERKEVSCEHSYEVCSGSGDKKSCTTHYEHFEDYDWYVHTNVGRVEIRRVDDQGVKTPSRWASAIVGEPASVEHWYTDYVKGNAGSIFHPDENQIVHYEDRVFMYPEVYDYYRMSRVLYHSLEYREIASQLNHYLNAELIKMGSSHQVNIIVVITNYPQSFFTAQMAAWEGGRKNDLILMYGMDKGNIRWFESTSFFGGFGNNDLHSKLRQISVNKPLELDTVRSAVKAIDEMFVRNPMENNKYMLLSYDAPLWVILLSSLLAALSSAALSWLMGNYELTRKGFKRTYLNRRY